MRGSEERLKNILQTAMDGFWLVSQDGRLLEVNLTYCQMSGYSEQELLSMSITDIEAAESPGEIEAHLKETIIRGGARFESRHRRKDGSLFDVEVSAKTETGGGGKIVVFLRDISARKLAEEALWQSETTARNKLKAILDPESDIGTLELSDIIDTEDLQSMMVDFYELTGMLGAILDLSGNVLVAVGWQDICTKFHRCHPETLKNCMESDTLLTNGVPAGSFKRYLCKNNMWDMVTPLEVGGKHVGNVFIGQFFYKNEDPDVELFREQSRRYGFNEAEYLEALGRVPRFSREMVDAGMRFYSKLAGMISKLSFNAIQQARILAERELAAEKIKQSEEKFRLMTETSPLAIYMTSGLELTAEYINPTFSKLFGYTLEDVPCASAWWLLAYPDEDYRKQVLEEWQGSIAQAVRTNSNAEQVETVVTCKDGSRRNISWSFVSSGIQRWAFGLDLTERNRAEKNLRQLNDELELRVIERTAELNNSKDLLDQTSQLARIGGWELDLGTNDLIWTKETFLIHDLDPDFHPTVAAGVNFYAPEALPIISEAVTQTIEQGVPYDLELPLITAKGNRVMVRTLGKAYRKDGEIVKIGGVLQDITERIEAEDELRQLNASLEASNKELEAFSYSVSHDLRAPLRALHGFSSILLEEHSASLNKEGTRLLKVISDNASKMGYLVDDLLAFSRLSRQNLNLSQIDMHAMVEKLCDELMPEADKGKIELRLHDLAPAFGDLPMVRQLWQNLIDNALKYTSRNSTRLIEIGNYVEGAENIYFVKDNGVGFDAKYSHKLFGVFQRLHHLDEYAGTGVGLAIAHRIVQRQNGRIWAVGNINEGATFYFTLPQSQSPSSTST